MISHPTNNPNVCRCHVGNQDSGFAVVCWFTMLNMHGVHDSMTTLWAGTFKGLKIRASSIDQPLRFMKYIHGLFCQAAVFTLWLRAVHISPTHHFLRAESLAADGTIMSLHHATSVTPYQAAVTSSASATLFGGYPPTLFSHMHFIFPHLPSREPWLVRSFRDSMGFQHDWKHATTHARYWCWFFNPGLLGPRHDIRWSHNDKGLGILANIAKEPASQKTDTTGNLQFHGLLSRDE